MAYQQDVEIRNREGLHFRPIMQLVETAQRFACRLFLSVEDRQADARSPMELLMLVATAGTRVRVAGDGVDEREAVDSLVALIESGFDEP